MPRYQVNRELIARAPAHAKFMHCLPASRGVEVTDDVIDGPAVGRLRSGREPADSEKGILVWLAYPTVKRATEEQLPVPRHAGALSTSETSAGTALRAAAYPSPTTTSKIGAR